MRVCMCAPTHTTPPRLSVAAHDAQRRVVRSRKVFSLFTNHRFSPHDDTPRISSTDYEKARDNSCPPALLTIGDTTATAVAAASCLPVPHSSTRYNTTTSECPRVPDTTIPSSGHLPAARRASSSVPADWFDEDKSQRHRPR